MFCLLVYLIYKVANEWVGMSAKLITLKTTRFLLFVEIKPCDNRVTEKASTFSRASPCVLAPRPGLEPGTYGLTEHKSVKYIIKSYSYKHKRATCYIPCYTKNTEFVTRFYFTTSTNISKWGV